MKIFEISQKNIKIHMNIVIEILSWGGGQRMFLGGLAIYFVRSCYKLISRPQIHQRSDSRAQNMKIFTLSRSNLEIAEKKHWFLDQKIIEKSMFFFSNFEIWSAQSEIFHVLSTGIASLVNFRPRNEFIAKSTEVCGERKSKHSLIPPHWPQDSISITMFILC